MKKKITAIFLCVALVAIAVVGASLAYFTDTKSATNTFTVGNVKIDLLESSLHRENAGVANGATSTSELWSDVAKEGSGNTSKYKAGDTFYTDAQIEANAAEYKCENVQLIPGRSYHKMPYVKNTGSNDAYIRIRVMIPSAANNDFVAVKDGGVITNQWCSSCIGQGEFIDGKGGGWNNAPAIAKASVTKDGVTYDVYTFTRIEPLKAGAMTEWNVWNFIGINKDATSADIQKAIAAGAITATGDTMKLNVLVEADAIQAEGFANAAAAWAAFK